ncbi:hypothetical protein [Enterococcus timonensis]|uniref:hypothetical protein n=1 Tax=Enterococcus timonensis TaxID=1852364 RepID=UPI0008DB03B0|nr:hypothetical protein [Enterococcus timonensis]
MENPWINQLNQLKNGELTELFVPFAEYGNFRLAWLTFPEKMNFRGIASLGGDITYVYDPSSAPGKKTPTEIAEENL